MKFFIFLCLLSLASGQNCLNDCRVVCDPGTSPSSYGPPRASLPGKQGPKGDRGDRGLPGRDGLDNGELLSANQKKISKLERIVYKVLSEEIAKGNLYIFLLHELCFNFRFFVISKLVETVVVIISTSCRDLYTFNAYREKLNSYKPDCYDQ